MKSSVKEGGGGCNGSVEKELREGCLVIFVHVLPLVVLAG